MAELNSLKQLEPRMAMCDEIRDVDDVEPKIGGFGYPKMDGENNGSKPYEQMDDLEVFPYFWKHPCDEIFLCILGWRAALGGRSLGGATKINGWGWIFRVAGWLEFKSNKKRHVQNEAGRALVRCFFAAKVGCMKHLIIWVQFSMQKSYRDEY